MELMVRLFHLGLETLQSCPNHRHFIASKNQREMRGNDVAQRNIVFAPEVVDKVTILELLHLPIIVRRDRDLLK